MTRHYLVMHFLLSLSFFCRERHVGQKTIPQKLRQTRRRVKRCEKSLSKFELLCLIFGLKVLMGLLPSPCQKHLATIVNMGPLTKINLHKSQPSLLRPPRASLMNLYWNNFSNLKRWIYYLEGTLSGIKRVTMIRLSNFLL